RKPARSRDALRLTGGALPRELEAVRRPDVDDGALQAVGKYAPAGRERCREYVESEVTLLVGRQLGHETGVEYVETRVDERRPRWHGLLLGEGGDPAVGVDQHGALALDLVAFVDRHRGARAAPVMGRRGRNK